MSNINKTIYNKIITLKEIDIKDIYKTYKYKDIEYLRLIKCKDTKNIIKKLTNLKYLELIECENIKETKNNKNLETLIKINCINDLIKKNNNEYYLINPKLTKLKTFKYKYLNFKSSLLKYLDYIDLKILHPTEKYNYQNYFIPNTLINLKYINIQNMPNKLINIPNTLINLLSIKLIDCKIKEIPKTLINLKTINIKNNDITYIFNFNNIDFDIFEIFTYDEFYNNYEMLDIKLYNTFINLQNLYLNHCNFINNKKILFKTFINLKKLYLLKNNLYFKKNIINLKYFTNLKEIVIEDNKNLNKNINNIIIILNSINLIKIQILIGYNHNIIFPEKLNKLKYLDLLHCKFSYFPKCNNLKSLILINISNNFINNIFNNLNLNNLKILNIYKCKIENLPNNLINLNNIHLSFCNNIKYLPDNLINLKILKIDMCDNIKNIPNFDNLINLNISNCINIKNIKEKKI